MAERWRLKGNETVQCEVLSRLEDGQRGSWVSLMVGHADRAQVFDLPSWLFNQIWERVPEREPWKCTFCGEPLTAKNASEGAPWLGECLNCAGERVPEPCNKEEGAQVVGAILSRDRPPEVFVKDKEVGLPPAPERCIHDWGKEPVRTLNCLRCGKSSAEYSAELVAKAAAASVCTGECETRPEPAPLLPLSGVASSSVGGPCDERG